MTKVALIFCAIIFAACAALFGALVIAVILAIAGVFGPQHGHLIEIPNSVVLFAIWLPIWLAYAGSFLMVKAVIEDDV